MSELMLLFSMLLLFLFTSPFGLVYSLSNCSYQAVQEYLGLDKDNIKMTSLRPVLHWQTPTLIYADLYIISVTEVNEKAQTFSAHVFLDLSWISELTKWNPEDFCGINVMSVPQELLWIPDVTIVENIRADFSSQDTPYLKMLSNGLIAVGKSFTLTSSCKMNLYKFPFDTQTCTLTVQSVLYNIQEFVIEPHSNASMLTLNSKQFFQIQGEWDLQSINMSKTRFQASSREWDQLVYMVTIKRRPLLYVVILLLPVLYFMVFDLASYYIANDGGEKLSFKVTILLAVSVLLLILHDMLPSTSADIPLIGIYCTVIFTFMAVSLLETILVTFLRSCGETVADKFEGTTFIPPIQDNREGDSQPTPDTTANSDINLFTISVLKQLLLKLQTERLSTAEIKKQRKRLNWTKVAAVIDRTFFFIYMNSVIFFLQQIWQAWIP